MSNIQLDIEWTEAASRKIEKLMPRGNQDAFLALPPVECLPMEGDPGPTATLPGLAVSSLARCAC